MWIGVGRVGALIAWRRGAQVHALWSEQTEECGSRGAEALRHSVHLLLEV